jgi:hypothetical protein
MARRCSVCGDEIHSKIYYGDPATLYSRRPLCELCYFESEPCCYVFFGEDKKPYHITPTRNETGRVFKVKLIGDDPNNCFYTAYSDEYLLVYGQTIHLNHPAEKWFTAFDSVLRQIFNMDRIKYARVFCRTVDINRQRYEVFVKDGSDFILAINDISLAINEADYRVRKQG